jgi:signal transduction histidine kinase
MTIRTRLTLWYASAFFASALVIGGVAYNELVVEKRRAPASEADPPEEEVSDLLQIGLWFGLPAAVLGLAGGWLLTRKALTPLAALSQAAGRVNEYHLRETLPRSGNGDELDRLTEVFNAMTARLDDSFQRIREFTLHASHELKTPLTVLQGEFEAALQDPSLPPAHRERCHTQLEEVARLTRIVDGLTLLTKADAGQLTLARESLRLDELIRDAFADAQILARPREVQVSLGTCDEATVIGDRHRLRQLLLNLTDNAIKHNVPKGAVSIALRRLEIAAEIIIANTGPGITPEVLSRVFDPFFRGDPSHGSAVEGCGLGLSIARWIASAHGGDLQLKSTPGKETIATLRLPVHFSVGETA